MAAGALLVALVAGGYAARELISGGAATIRCPPTARGWAGRVTGAKLPATRPVMERRVLELVNSFRSSHGLPGLVASRNLAYAARWHSRDQLERHYFAHERVGLSYTQRLARYSPSTCLAENIAKGYLTAPGVVDAWKRSPGHREVMLLRWVRRAGVGVAGPYATLDASA